MFTLLGIVFMTILFTMLALIFCNVGSSQYTDSIFDNTSTGFLINVIVGLLCVGTIVCWLKACS